MVHGSDLESVDLDLTAIEAQALAKELPALKAVKTLVSELRPTQQRKRRNLQ